MPKVLPKNSLLMRIHAGEGRYTDEKTGEEYEIELSTTTQGTPVVEFIDDEGSGTAVYMVWNEIILMFYEKFVEHKKALAEDED